VRVVRRFPRAVRVIENLWVPLPDGCRLSARVWLPDDAELPPFDPPEAAPEPDLTPLREAPFTRTVTRDLITDVSTYRVAADGGEFAGAAVARIEDIDLTVGYTIDKTFRIHEYDPAPALARIEQVTEHARGAWSTRLAVATELTADRERFHLRARIRALEGDTEFLTRTWDETIPRKLV
jgi:hypothetical protein